MENQSLSNLEFLKIKKINYLKKSMNVAVITGAFGRIGSVFLNELLERNYTCICLSIDKLKYINLKKTLPLEKYKKIFWIKYDLNKIEDIDKVIKKIKIKYKKIE